MMTKPLKHRVVTGTIWATIDRFGNMGLQFVANIILARLLTPVDFGMIGVLTIFIVVSQVLIDGGFGSALIQKKEPTQEDYSTIFWWNLFLSIILYLILFFCAPLIEEFFRMPGLTGIVRGICLILPFSSLSVIQNNRLRKQLLFQKIAFSNIISFCIGAIVGIITALKGWGPWSLVAMQVINSLFQAFIFWIITKWKPSFLFSIRIFKKLFNFGGYLFLANIMQEVCRNFQSIIIGRKFNATQMGLYSQAYKLESVASNSISGVIVQVMFPLYSSVQDDEIKLRQMVLMNVRVISLLVFPFLGMLILIGNPLITFLYGEKWVECVPYFQILCLAGIFTCMQNINYFAVAAKGASRPLLVWGFYKWGMSLVLLLLGMLFGMFGIVWATVFSSLNIWIVNISLTRKYVGLRYTEQFKAISPIFFLTTGCMGLAIFLSGKLNVYIITLIYLLLIVSLPIIFNYRSLRELKATIKTFIAKRVEPIKKE